MSALESLAADALIIGHPRPESVDVGADFVSNLKDASRLLEGAAPYPVLILAADVAPLDQIHNFFDKLAAAKATDIRILIRGQASFDVIAQLVNRGSVLAVLPSFEDKDFEATIQKAFEESRRQKQEAQLLRLIQEQNESLKRLSVELEDRVQKRQAFLIKSHHKLTLASDRLEALHLALVAVHRASSVGELERLLNNALRSALSLQWTRILFKSQNLLGNAGQMLEKVYSVYRVDLLPGRQGETQICFAREHNRPYTKEEKTFLTQVAEAVALAIDRLGKLETLETLKHQWEATFDAISNPLSLIDEDYTIFRTNRAYTDQTSQTLGSLVGQKCYKILFGRSSPCENCRLGAQFRLSRAKTVHGSEATFDVSSQMIQLKPLTTKLYVTLYRDITDQQRLELQILESAKLAELGTVGSSIAHEINNPLGGMMSFLQLIRMDLKGDEPFYQDIAEMESGTRRCADIVQNLLGFSRMAPTDQPRRLDLRDVIARSIKITELQTRSKGIHVRLNLPQEPCELNGQPNLLAQALCSLLQMSVSSILKLQKNQTSPTSEICVCLKFGESQEELIVEISHAGSFGDADDIALTVTRQILSEHAAELEIFSSPGHRTVARISFSRPVF